MSERRRLDARDGLHPRGLPAGFGQCECRRWRGQELQPRLAQLSARPDDPVRIGIGQLARVSDEQIGRGQGLDRSAAAVRDVEFDEPRPGLCSVGPEGDNRREMVLKHQAGQEAAEPGLAGKVMAVNFLVHWAHDARGRVSLGVALDGPHVAVKNGPAELEAVRPAVSGPVEDDTEISGGHDDPVVALLPAKFGAHWAWHRSRPGQVGGSLGELHAQI